MKDARCSEVSRARTLEELLQLAAMRGYSSGWAYRIHTARLGNTQRSLNQMLQVRIRRMEVTMRGFGITREMLEEYLGHSLEFTIPDELDQLKQVWRSLKGALP